MMSKIKSRVYEAFIIRGLNHKNHIIIIRNLGFLIKYNTGTPVRNRVRIHDHNPIYSVLSFPETQLPLLTYIE